MVMVVSYNQSFEIYKQNTVVSKVKPCIKLISLSVRTVVIVDSAHVSFSSKPGFEGLHDVIKR